MAHSLVQTVLRVLTLVIIVDVLVSFLLPPNNRFREVLDRIVNPMLDPIRRIVPPISHFDFSPVILLIILQIIERILLKFLS